MSADEYVFKKLPTNTHSFSPSLPHSERTNDHFGVSDSLNNA